MKKLVSILLAGSILAAICPCVGFAAEGSEGGGTTTGTFTYTENFDTLSAEALEGWTIYTPLEAANTVASVSDGALTLTNNSVDKGEWILFDALTSVSNKSLIMECDITHLDNASGTEDSVAGLAYMVDIGTSSTTNINDTGTVDDSAGTNKDPNFTGLKGNYAALMTNSENPSQLVSVRRQKTDRRSTVFTAPQDNNSDIADSGVKAMNRNNNDPIHLKIQYQNVKYLPYIYINGVNVIRNEDTHFKDWYTNSFSNEAMTDGKVGFYIKNASVKIDNLTISGTGTYPDTKKYESAFKKTDPTYATVDDAKNDVVVSEYNYFGNYVRNAANGATKVGTDNGNGTGTISVKYGAYSTTLQCKILPKETRGFVYEENFDTMANGDLPAGWTLYRNHTATDWRTIKAQVNNGALEISENNNDTGGRGGYLIFDIPELKYVKNLNLTMECDITLGNSLGVEIKPTGVDCVGFAYAFEESKITGAIDNSTGVNVVTGGVDWESAFRVTMYTNKDKDEAGENITKQILLSEKYNEKSVYRTNTITSNVNKINTAETAQTMKLKIYIPNISYFPKIFLNDSPLTNTDGDFVTPNRTIGKIGLYIRNTAVTIDNIKITGTTPEFSKVTNNSLAISSVKYDPENKKLNVMADASLKAADSSGQNSAIIAAVYDNNDRFVSSKIVSVDTSKVVDYHGTIAINGVSSEPAAGKVKLFFWNLGGMMRFVHHDINSNP